MSTQKSFIYGSLVDENNLCNFEKEAEQLVKGCLRGKRYVVFGRRNFGKTSLVRNVVAGRFLAEQNRKKRKGMVIYANFLGIADKADLNRELRIAFTKAFSACFPLKEVMGSLGRFFTGLRPNMSLDPLTGETSFGLTLADGGGEVPFEDIMTRIGNLASQGGVYPLLIMDEFQDLHFISGGEAKMRDALESLPSGVAVIVLGSKKHILSKIFARPDAPLAGWGEDIEMPCIEKEVYRNYANERFALHRLYLPPDSSTFLQERLDQVPEAMNMVCSRLIDLCGDISPPKKVRTITTDDVGIAILSWLDARSDRYREYLAGYTSHESKVLAAVARKGLVKAPQSKDFLMTIPGISSSGCARIIKKLEDNAVVYRDSGENAGYFLADPLLAEFLRRF